MFAGPKKVRKHSKTEKNLHRTPNTGTQRSRVGNMGRDQLIEFCSGWRAVSDARRRIETSGVLFSEDKPDQVQLYDLRQRIINDHP